EGATFGEVLAGLVEGGKQLPETWIAAILGSAAQTGPVALAEAFAPSAPTREPPPPGTMLPRPEIVVGPDGEGRTRAEFEREQAEDADFTDFGFPEHPAYPGPRPERP